jgi:hypothetical protein
MILHLRFRLALRTRVWAIGFAAILLSTLTTSAQLECLATPLSSRLITPPAAPAPAPAPTEGLPDFEIRVDSIPEGSRLSDRVASGLRSRPLNLEIEVESSKIILGMASRRPSQILSGWHEIVTVRVDISDSISQGKPSSAAIKISTTVYVNRQNTDRPSDWTLPTRQQEILWVESIRKNIRKSLDGVCKRQEWHGRNELYCSP